MPEAGGVNTSGGGNENLIYHPYGNLEREIEKLKIIPFWKYDYKLTF